MRGDFIRNIVYIQLALKHITINVYCAIGINIMAIYTRAVFFIRKFKNNLIIFTIYNFSFDKIILFQLQLFET